MKAADVLKAGTELKKTQEEIGREIVPEDLGFRPVVAGKEVEQGNTSMPAADASAKALADAKALSAKHQQLRAAKYCNDR